MHVHGDGGKGILEPLRSRTAVTDLYLPLDSEARFTARAELNISLSFESFSGSVSVPLPPSPVHIRWQKRLAASFGKHISGCI
jgi:hypothetical protein